MLNITNIGIVLIFLSVVMAALPVSPFSGVISQCITQISGLIPTIAYFIPLAAMAALTEAWLLAVTAYIIISLLARWIKLVS